MNDQSTPSPRLPYATDERIDAFCRELAQILRQLTGRQATVTQEDMMAPRVRATPSRKTKSSKAKR
ncbi:MAG: hypothetical protein JW850_06695 [Thermoflexales bacterium]|nr:hypothetical protein [Thermoflexales bacterium]